MTNLNNLVDEIYLINLERRQDRFKLADQQLQQICSHYSIVRPEKHENPKVSFNETCLGIMKGVKDHNEECLYMDIKERDPISSIAIFEDDFELQIKGRCNPLHVICFAITELNAHRKGECDILYLGANLLDGTPIRSTAFTHQIFKAWTTHAVIYNIRAINYIARNYKDTTEMFDAWLSKQIEAGELNAFITSPMVAWQRPDKSDIWGVDADYTQCFIDSEKKLR